MHTNMNCIYKYVAPCQRMETLSMGLSCVDLVKMGKILDTYVHKKTKQQKLKDVICLLVNISSFLLKQLGTFC